MKLEMTIAVRKTYGANQERSILARCSAPMVAERMQTTVKPKMPNRKYLSSLNAILTNRLCVLYWCMFFALSEVGDRPGTSSFKGVAVKLLAARMAEVY